MTAVFAYTLSLCTTRESDDMHDLYPYHGIVENLIWNAIFCKESNISAREILRHIWHEILFYIKKRYVHVNSGIVSISVWNNIMYHAHSRGSPMQIITYSFIKFLQICVTLNNNNNDRFWVDSVRKQFL